jgi:rhodanese-related sulfurtransferase
VWEDTDGDGIHDPDESGISDVGVILHDANENLVNSSSTQAGIYRFDDLAPEEYYIFFNVPSPYLFSPMDEGEDDEVDSDSDATGRTDDFLLTEGEDLTLDAGVFQHDSGHVEITAQEAKDMIDTNPQLIVVDVREESEFCGEGGHISGARNLPWNSGVFEQRFNELPMDGDILLVCRSGHRTTHAAEFLDSKGYTSVFNMDDGMSAWEWETVGCEIHSGGGSGGSCFIVTVAEGFPLSHILVFVGMALLVTARTWRSL